MHHRLVHRSDHGVTRAGLISGRLLVAIALLLGTMSLGLHGADARGSQSGGSFDYDQDGLQWSLSYDDSVWTESTADTADLSLETDNGSITQFLTLPDVYDDPASCLAGVVPQFNDGAGVTDSVAAEDDNGEPIADESDAYAYEVQTITLDAQGQSVQGDAVHVCFDLGNGGELWAVALVPDVPGTANDVDAVYTLLDGVSVAGDSVPVGLSEGGTSGTPAAGTPAASNAATPTAGNGTPAAGNGTPAAGSGDGDYTSPTYGYTLTFSPDDWSVDGEIAAADNSTGRDRLDLTNADGSSLLYIEGSEEWTDPDDCVSTLLDEIGVDPSAADPVEDPDTGDPYEVSEDGHSAVAYTGSANGEGATALVDCRQDPNSDLIVGVTNLTTEFNDYFGQEYPAVEDVLNSLEF